MSDRDRFQALMLEHLYGLLDADEVRELEAYLATTEGAELRARGELWRARLAGAAKVPFPAAVFAPPGETSAPEPVARPAAPAPVSMRIGAPYPSPKPRSRTRAPGLSISAATPYAYR